MASLPFAFKLLTAPVLDTYYIGSFGKRKSYIIPIQYFMALIFFITSFEIEQWIQDANILALTSICKNTPLNKSLFHDFSCRKPGRRCGRLGPHNFPRNPRENRLNLLKYRVVHRDYLRVHAVHQFKLDCFSQRIHLLDTLN